MAKKKTSGNFYMRWRKRRRYARDAKALLKECRRLLRKFQHRLNDEVISKISGTADELSRARAEKHIKKMGDGIQKLDELLDKHLAYGRKSAIREYTESIGVAVFIALLLRAFVVEAFKIPSGSMLPTLQVGDHLFVYKVPYGIRLPWTDIKFFAGLPDVASVVVFVPPPDPEDPQTRSKDYIKRVVAVGGETVALKDDVLYRNGIAVPRKEIPGKCGYVDARHIPLVGNANQIEEYYQDCKAYVETIDEQKFVVYQNAGVGGEPRLPVRFPSDYLPCPPKTKLVREGDMPACKVEAGHAFFMGDNRDNSRDGRYFGGVPASDIKGRAAIIWLSYDGSKGLRWNRFFRLVHTGPEEG
jgi:signal peptidase I